MKHVAQFLKNSGSINALYLLLCSASAVAAEEVPMLINQGVGGGWYEPTTSGQGLVFDVIPDTNQMVAYWFTYPETVGSREWFVAQGDISGDTAELVIYQTEYGVFDQPGDVELNAVGKATLAFESCESAVWNYGFESADLSGEIDLARLGPTGICKKFLEDASLNAVSRSNAWVDLSGTWKFEGCVQLGPASSHGMEWVEFTGDTISLEIENYNSPDCQGAVFIQQLSFHMQRVDKTTAFLDGAEVIANRYVLTDVSTGQEIRQIWYVDDSGGAQMITHGDMDSPVDQEGFPTELHTVFFQR